LSPLFGSFCGKGFMLAPEVLAAGKEAGYANGFEYYAVGRGGVLGDCDADVVVAAFGFFEPGLVRKMWQGGIGVEGARAAGHRYAVAACDWGRKYLDGCPGLARFVELAEKLVAGVDPAGLPLFAGWRAEPRPSDPEGAAYLLIQILREWRGNVFVTASVAQGLAPLTTKLLSGAADEAKLFGWQPPYPDVESLRPLRDAAEANTSARCESVYDCALTADERAELVALTQGIAEHFAAAG
jgi:hypothetical protein